MVGKHETVKLEDLLLSKSVKVPTVIQDSTNTRQHPIISHRSRRFALHNVVLYEDPKTEYGCNIYVYIVYFYRHG